MYAMTSYQSYVLKQLNNGITLTSEMIDKLIIDHATEKDRAYKSWQRYLASKEGVPIKTRELPDYAKINNKIANDFMGEVIDTKTGFFTGIPINYDLDKTKYEEQPKGMMKKIYDAFVRSKNTSFQAHTDLIERFITLNNLHDLDTEIVKLMAACGYAGRKLYIDTEGLERTVNLFPWETIFLTNPHNETEYALRYFPELNDDGELVTKVEFYDSFGITYYAENQDENSKSEIKYILDPDQPLNKNPLKHPYEYCPIVIYENNNERQGDCDKVVDLIDNYDRAFSDMSSEIEQFRLAYMYFVGQEPTEEIMQQVLQTGAFGFEEGSEAGFITKNLDPSFHDSFFKRIEDNIQRFTKHVNFMDENFAGQATGIALQYKLQALSNKTIVLESKFKTASRYMFKILCSSWKKRNAGDIDFLNIFLTCKRNLPTDYLYEAQVTAALKGNISERTRLGLLSFVDDVDYEMEEMKKDNEALNVEYTNPNANAEDEYSMNGLEDDEDDQEAV